MPGANSTVAAVVGMSVAVKRMVNKPHGATALLLALDLGHKLPDCVYLTLAEREGCSLSTGDARLARLAQSRNVGVLGVGAAARRS